MKRWLFCLLALAPGILCAQAVKLEALDKLASKASDSVTVTLDGPLLQLASRFLSNDDPDQAKVKKLVAGLKGVYVRSFDFDKPGQYQASDLEPIRSQLRDAKWKKIVEVRGRSENSEVMLRQEDEHTISGLSVIVTEPTELTVIYIDGPIDMDGLSKLGGNFGIPEDIGEKVKKESEKDKEKKAK